MLRNDAEVALDAAGVSSHEPHQDSSYTVIITDVEVSIPSRVYFQSLLSKINRFWTSTADFISIEGC